MDALAYLLPSHQKDVQRARRGDGCKGNKAREGYFCGWRDVLEAGDEAVEAESNGARGGDGEEVGLNEGGGGEGRGLVGVSAVDGDVEGLVGDLPEEGAPCLEGDGGS